MNAVTEISRSNIVSIEGARAEIDRIVGSFRARGVAAGEGEVRAEMTRRVKALAAEVRKRPEISEELIDRNQLVVLNQARACGLVDAVRVLLQTERNWSAPDAEAKFGRGAAFALQFGGGQAAVPPASFDGAAWLRAVRDRGLAITLDDESKISVSPASLLRPADRQLLAAHRDAILGALRNVEKF